MRNLIARIRVWLDRGRWWKQRALEALDEHNLEVRRRAAAELREIQITRRCRELDREVQALRRELTRRIARGA